MADLLYVGILIAFFLFAALFVRGCERLVGRVQSERDVHAEPAVADAEVAA